MYTVVVSATFSAIHRVAMPDGTLEPPHGHDWIVRAFFSREELDAHGMVVDFCHAQATLRAIVGEWHHGNLNRAKAFTGVSPTAERVARVVYDRLHDAGLTQAHRVEVTEAPDCVAAFEA